jgi:hypothetical protein
MVNFGLLCFTADLGPVMMIFAAVYRICLNASPDLKPISAGLFLLGLYFLGSNCWPFSVLNRPTLPMRAVPFLARATGE